MSIASTEIAAAVATSGDDGEVAPATNLAISAAGAGEHVSSAPQQRSAEDAIDSSGRLSEFVSAHSLPEQKAQAAQRSADLSMSFDGDWHTMIPSELFCQAIGMDTYREVWESLPDLRGELAAVALTLMPNAFLRYVKTRQRFDEVDAAILSWNETRTCHWQRATPPTTRPLNNALRR